MVREVVPVEVSAAADAALRVAVIGADVRGARARPSDTRVGHLAAVRRVAIATRGAGFAARQQARAGRAALGRMEQVAHAVAGAAVRERRQRRLAAVRRVVVARAEAKRAGWLARATRAEGG